MCGIAGIINCKEQNIDPTLIESITSSMSHRGPDAVGYFVEDEIGLGHRRLSIIDVSEIGNQPFFDVSGRYVMVFNGEIYNYLEIKALLPDYPFKSSSDTEVIIAAFSKWGISCVQHFKGMFAFAIWDRKQKELTLVRDRFGVKPVYYFFDGQYFIFASEVRAILKSGKVKAKINSMALNEYFSFQSVGAPLSFIEDVEQLQAGCYLTLAQNKVEVHQYWSLLEGKSEFDWNNKTAVHNKIEYLLTKSVERRLVSDVPIGAFLSGGIDSSVIVGLMAKVSTGRVNTFTVGFEEKEFDESEYAAIIAKKFNTNHSRLLLKPDIFLEELTNALNAMDTPSGDGINTYVVSKAIKQSGLTVALSGVGGDELFAGYPFFNQFMQLKKYQLVWDLTKWLRKGAGYALGNSSKALRIKQLFNSKGNSIRYFYPEFRRIIAPNLLASLTHVNTFSNTMLQKHLLNLPPELGKFPLLSQVSIAEYMGYTQQTLLKDTDQFSMAVALEVREPFFDHDLVQFVLSVPDAIKKTQYPKSLLVESVSGLLPNEVVHRKKQGFLFPWSKWMKNELRSFCDMHIERISKRDFINGDKLRQYWNRFLKNDASVRWMEVWLFVVLEYWMEKNGIE